MRIAYAIPVERIDAMADGRAMALGIESWLVRVPSVPWQISPTLLLCFACSPNEAHVDHVMKARVLDPDIQNAVPEFEVTFKVAPNPNAPAGWEVRTPIPLRVTFEVNAPGAYSVEIEVAGRITSVPILVEVLEPPA